MQRMTLDEARDILNRHNRGDKTIEMIDWQLAGLTVYNYYQQHRDLLRPMPVGDIAPIEATRHENPDEGGDVGPRRILRLQGPASAYQILTTAIDDIMLDPGGPEVCYTGRKLGS